MTWDPYADERSTPPATAPWQPGAPPDPSTVVHPTPGYPAPPPPPPDRRRRTLPVVAAGLAVVVLVAGAVSLGLVLRYRNPPSAAPAAAGTPGTSATGSSGTPDAGMSAPPTSAAATSAATTATTASGAQTSTQRYAGPGGITVQGPAGWIADTSSGASTVADYRSPDSPARLAGATFRIGIGNPTPGPDFGSEVQQAIAYLQSRSEATIISTSTTTYLGATAADIEYTYFNTDVGAQRQGIERLWRHGGVTMIIQSSDLATTWPAAQQVFDLLVDSAQVP